MNLLTQQEFPLKIYKYCASVLETSTVDRLGDISMAPESSPALSFQPSYTPSPSDRQRTHFTYQQHRAVVFFTN